MKGAGRGSDGLFRFPNGDGDQSEKRYHVGIIVEKTGEDKGDTKKLRTMHVYSRSVNILYGRLPCSEDWRQYSLGDWIQFNVRGGKYFNNYRMNTPYESRISPNNELVVQVNAYVFFAPDFINRRTTSRDGKRYYKMWSPELGGVYIDEYSMNAFGISPKDNIVYKGWLSSSHEMNFAPNDMDPDGWPVDRSLYWQLCYVAGQTGSLEKHGKDMYDTEVHKLYIECEKQAKEEEAKLYQVPIHDRLADEFNKRDHSSQLIPETEKVALPKIVVDKMIDLKPCVIASTDTSMADDITGFKALPRASTQTNTSGMFGSGSSLMSGFGFSGYGKQSNLAGTGTTMIKAEPEHRPRNSVFQGFGFNYEQVPAAPEPSSVMCADIRNSKTPTMKTFGITPPHIVKQPVIACAEPIAAEGDASTGNKGFQTSQFQSPPQRVVPQVYAVENRESSYGVVNRTEPRNTGGEEAVGIRGFHQDQFQTMHQNTAPQMAPIGNNDRNYGFPNRVEPRNVVEEVAGNRIIQTSRFQMTHQNSQMGNNERIYGDSQLRIPLSRGFNTVHASATGTGGVSMNSRPAADNISNAFAEMRVDRERVTPEPRYGGIAPRMPLAADGGSVRHAFAGGSGPRVENGVAIGGFRKAPSPGNNNARPF